MPDTTPSTAPKPTVRLLLHLARTGGTIISKCLAVMPNVALLSEIHPMGLKMFNPLRQAHEWFGLLTPQDIEGFRQARRMEFADAIDLARRRCEERGLKLVIREWNHLDFHGMPYVPNPPHKLMTTELLSPRFRLLRYCTVRHPIDHWISLNNVAVVHDKLTLEQFLTGCLEFAEHAVKIGFVRYEDFTRDPAPAMRTICTALEIDFDPTFEHKWASYKKITGDRAGSRGGVEKIVALARKPVEAGLVERFERNAAYQKTLALLGYNHPE